MLELTQEERKQIQQEIELVKSSQPLKVQNTVSNNMPISPDGKNAVQDLEKAISAQATPDERETRKIKKRIIALRAVIFACRRVVLCFA